MRRRFFQLFAVLLSCVLLSGTSVSYAGESESEATDLFQLVLYADESLDNEQAELELSGIRIDVYSSELASHDGESGGSTYTHDEFFSVYTDAEGQVQFSRPTEKFLILVDVSTLPRNTGIAISTKFYRENITQDRLAISKVDKIVIDKIETSEEEFYVNAYNKEGTRINVDFTLSEISSEIVGNTKTVCLEARVGDMKETCEYTIPVVENKKPEIHCVEYVEDLLVDADADVKEDSVMTERADPAKVIGEVLFMGFLRFIKTRLLW